LSASAILRHSRIQTDDIGVRRQILPAGQEAVDSGMSGAGHSRAFSVLLFTVEMNSCAIPPIP
jgi:hypothetical protein